MTSPQEDPENAKWTERYGQAIRWAFGLWTLGVCSILFFTVGTKVTLEQAGQFGDGLGAVNTLFSGLAFATLVITMLMQRDELKLQRKEMEQTRRVMEGQREQMAAQNEISRKTALLQSLPSLVASLNERFGALAHAYSHEVPYVNPALVRSRIEEIEAFILRGSTSLAGKAPTGDPHQDLALKEMRRELIKEKEAYDLLKTLAESLEAIERLNRELLH